MTNSDNEPCQAGQNSTNLYIDGVLDKQSYIPLVFRGVPYLMLGFVQVWVTLLAHRQLLIAISL